MDRDLLSLEYPKILARLSEHAVSIPGKETCEALVPFEVCEDARIALQETDCAFSLVQRYGAPSFSSLKNVSGCCRRAEAGAVLSIRELLDVGGTLRAGESLYNYLQDHAAESGVFDGYFIRLMPNKYLSQKIADSFVGEDEVTDGASTNLRDIRRKMVAARDKIRTSLDGLMRTHAKYLQESIVTVRNGRYVIPVKAEHRADVSGLVHDTSASGQTLFIEPMSVVQANNDLTVLEGKEREEIEKILAGLSAEVGSFAGNIISDFEITRFFDFTFAKARYALELDGSMPTLNETGNVCLRGARHPLIDKKKCVPIDLELGKKYDALIVTGPNTGGKTVSLKTTGILCLMAASGLFIPAKEGSDVAFFDHVYADIGDDQSIEQSLSTFSAHMTNIIAILNKITPSSLVLMDELGSGTDPIEGAALATAVIEHIRAVGAKQIATTHYAELKLHALQTHRVENASCEFDVATLRPTYRLLVGIPGRSNAFAIASRLGMGDDIIEDAKARIDKENVRMENVLADMEISRKSAEIEIEQAEKLRTEAAEMLRRAEQSKQSAQDDVNRQINAARDQAYEILEKARREAAAVLDEADRIRKEKERADFKAKIDQGKKDLSKKIDEAQKGLDTREKRVAKPIEGKLRKGDDVHVVSLDKEGVVMEEPDGKKDTVLVQIGVIKTRIKLNDIERSEKKKKVTFQAAKSDISGVARGSRQVTTELDIRGMSVLEADGLIDEFIDSAALASLHTVSIIHGKGTGVLREAVHDKLRHMKQVDTFRVGVFGEGENGVTIVTLQ